MTSGQVLYCTVQYNTLLSLSVIAGVRHKMHDPQRLPTSGNGVHRQATFPRNVAGELV